MPVSAAFSATFDMDQGGGQAFDHTLGLTITVAQTQEFAWVGNLALEFSITPDFTLSPNLVVPTTLNFGTTLGMGQDLGLTFAGVVTFTVTPGMGQMAGGIAEGVVTFLTTLHATIDGRISLVDVWAEADTKPYTEYREGD